MWPHLGRGGRAGKKHGREERGRAGIACDVICGRQKDRKQREPHSFDGHAHAEGAHDGMGALNRKRRCGGGSAAEGCTTVICFLSILATNVSTGIGICGRGQEKAFIHARALALSHCLSTHLQGDNSNR